MVVCRTHHKKLMSGSGFVEGNVGEKLHTFEELMTISYLILMSRFCISLCKRYFWLALIAYDLNN